MNSIQPHQRSAVSDVRAQLDRTSDVLLQARRDSLPLLTFPGPLPASLAEAYAIQTRSIEKWGDRVVGWKVGGVSPHLQSVYQQKWLAGPIFEQRVQVNSDGPVEARIFDRGFGAVEAEFVLELRNASSISSESPSIEEILPFISACYVGVEIASSPIRSINDFGPTAVVSDFGNNNGLIIGSEVQDWSPQSLTEIKILSIIEGQIVGEAYCRAPPAGPVAAAAFLIGNLNSRGLAIPDTLKVSTGALTGIHEVRTGERALITFEGIDAIDIEISASTDKLT